MVFSYAKMDSFIATNTKNNLTWPDRPRMKVNTVNHPKDISAYNIQQLIFKNSTWCAE